MNISYLILAHNNFAHLTRLIDALDDGCSRFYIHLDKKVKEDYINSKDEVFIIPERFDISWGGYKMVEATLALMRYAYNHRSTTDYFILISGCDYPIRPRKFLYNQLNLGKEFIDISPMPTPYKPIERFNKYYFEYDRRRLKFYNPKFLVEVLLKKINIKRKIPFTLYVGTQWFALTHDCLEYILYTLAGKNPYEKFFRHSLVPDEAFFQTIIGNSKFRDNTVANLTYTDWQVPVPPARIIDKHIDFLKTNIKFDDEYGQRFPYFARKFDDDSTEILQRIRNELW